MTDDLLPTSPQARALLDAMAILKAAGIEAVFDIEDTIHPVETLRAAGIELGGIIDPPKVHQFRLGLVPALATPAGKDELTQSIQSALVYQQQAIATTLAVLQAKKPKE